MAEVSPLERIGVVGAGAIGGFLAALFSSKGYDVFCVSREETRDEIAKRGISIESSVFGDFTSHPKAVSHLSVPVDILFITVKSPFLSAALRLVPRSYVEHAVVVPLLNGIGHREYIRDVMGASVAVGMIGRVEVSKDNDGIIRHHSGQPPHIDIASDEDVSPDRLRRVASAIRATGISVDVLSREAEVIWKKLVRLNAIASLTAAFQEPIGTIRINPHHRTMLENIVAEGARIAEREGVSIDPRRVMEEIDKLPGTLTTSLSRDVKAGVLSEVEAIPGGILQRGKMYNIPTPHTQQVYDAIRARIEKR